MPQISMLVDVFLEATGAEEVKADVAHCWSELPQTVPWQRVEGTFADVISHLDSLAQHLPTMKAWDELVCLPPSAVPCTLCRSGHLGYIQGQVVELGSVLPSTQFHVSQPNGEFGAWPGGCSLRAMSWPMTLPAMKWSGFPCGAYMAEDLSQAEEASARELSNMVPLDSAKEAQRLD